MQQKRDAGVGDFRKASLALKRALTSKIKMEAPLRISLKLADGKAPHLYVTQIKAMMENDETLHPMMKKTLILLKRTRTPFIKLPLLKEVVIDGANHRHFDRSADPPGAWVCTLWSEDEISRRLKDPKGHLKAILHLFTSLGYELYNSKECTSEYVNDLARITSKQIDSQLEARGER